MTDQLSEMFNQARAAALPSVRPPGAAAARRTVRRRRTTTAVAAAAVAVLAVVGLTTLPFKPPAEEAAVPPIDPAADAAYNAVVRVRPNFSGIESTGPVYADYSRRETVYVPSLTLTVACVGTGRFTLLVEGRPDDQGNPARLAEAPVTCGATPVVVERQLTMPNPITSEVHVRVVDADARAQFSYRLTGPRVYDVMDPLNSPVEAIKWPGGTAQFTEAGQVRPSTGWQKAEAVAMVPGARYIMSAACAGAGTLVLQARQADADPTELRAPCSWPPSRYAVTLPPTAAGSTLWVRYESDDPAPAQYAWAVS